MLSWLDGVLTLSLSLVKSNATVDCVAFVVSRWENRNPNNSARIQIDRDATMRRGESLGGWVKEGKACGWSSAYRNSVNSGKATSQATNGWRRRKRIMQKLGDYRYGFISFSLGGLLLNS